MNKNISDVKVSSNLYLKFDLNFFVNVILIRYCISILVLSQFQRRGRTEPRIGHERFLALPL